MLNHQRRDSVTIMLPLRMGYLINQRHLEYGSLSYRDIREIIKLR